MCVCVEGVVVGLWGAPELGFIPTQQPSNGEALAPLVESHDFAHLRVAEMGWGNVPLEFCGVPMRES